MAAIVGEELLGAEAGAAGAKAGGFQYSGGGIGGANYGGIGFEQFGNAEGYASTYRGGTGLPSHPVYGDLTAEKEASSSAFKQDTKPKGFNFGKLYNADFIVSKVGGIAQGIVSTIDTVYNNYRSDKQLKINRAENTKDRYRAGIVFQGRENRDQLVRENRIPAYYSTSNIKSLLRRGIMPFGWNSEMAVEQGFGQEVFAQEQKAVSKRRSEEFLQREKDKIKLRQTLGDLKNLRDKFKTRKILEYYSQN